MDVTGLKLSKVTDLDIPALEVYKTLRDNVLDTKNSCIADSPKVVNLLLESDIEVHSILATQDYYDEYEAVIREKNIPVLYVCDKALMQTIVGHKLHHNCMMHAQRPLAHPLDALDETIVMLDNITSSENVGAIARSMAGMGVKSYLLPTSSPHPYGRRALRVSMGYMSHVKYHVYADIRTTIHNLKAQGYSIFAAEVCEGSEALMDVVAPEKWVLIMGHEGKGIAKEILDLCDTVVSIEMQTDVKSFNVSVAASLIMYQFKNRYNCV